MNSVKYIYFLVFILCSEIIAQNPCGDMDLLSVNDTTICNNQSITLVANSGFDTYEWSTNSNNQAITINSPGIYTVSTSFTTNNLVTNGNFGSGNSGFSSEYIYNASSLWNEGTYAITTNANFVHSGFTGTGDGFFLVVNGATNPGNQVWCQDVTVTPNTLYNFSTLVNTVAGVGNPALLQFSINGTVIGNQFSAPNSLNNWEEFNATWNSGNNMVAEICIVNQNITGSGNDFGLDDITFTTLCTASESINVELTTQADATIFNVDVQCESGSSINLNAVDPNGQWSGNGILNSTTGLFSPSAAGNGEHIITYQISGACGDMDTTLIEVVEIIEPEIIAPDEICLYDTPVSLDGIPGPGTWDGIGITDQSTGIFSPLEANLGENVISYAPNLFCTESTTHEITVHEFNNPEYDFFHEICLVRL